MTFLEFKNQLFDLACFNIYQVYAWQSDFDRNSLYSLGEERISYPVTAGILCFL